MSRPKILVFAGSTRSDSFNKQLAACAARQLEALGADVTLVDLRDYPMPLYDGDQESEQGLPDKAIELKELMAMQDGFLISSPEYNSSISAVLKNCIDWASRPHLKDEPSKRAFSGKTAALVSASPGALGGLRGLVHLRMILSNMDVTVIPSQFALSSAHQAFSESGELSREQDEQSLSTVTEALFHTARRLQAV